MFYIVESSKSFYEANLDLGPVVERLGFVILHRQDIGETLQRRGIEFDEDCQVHEVINYRYAADLLAIDMRLGLTLPWRIAVYTENGVTYMTGVLPGQLPDGANVAMPVTFILDDKRLVTVRHHAPRPFETFPTRAGRSSCGATSPERIFLGLIEEIIGRMADL